MLKISIGILWFFTQSGHAAETKSTPTAAPTTAAPTTAASPADAESSCSPLSPGSSLTINQTGADSPTGIQRSYRLTRDRQDSKVYHVDLPIGFATSLEATIQQLGNTSATHLSPNDRDPGNGTPAAALAGKVARAQMTATFVARTNECYASMRGKLFAADGTQLHLALTPATSELSRAVVAISPSPHRSNVTDWSRTSVCSVIIHESMHWLGLSDGYPESRFSCRSLEPKYSIMHDEQAALDSNFDLADCGPMEQPGTSTPVTNVASVDSITCPAGAAPEFQRNLTRAQFLQYRDTHPNRNYFFSGAQTVRAPLMPAHVRMITQPNCRSANERYLTCVQNSYRGKSQGCIQTPDYCRKAGYLN